MSNGQLYLALHYALQLQKMQFETTKLQFQWNTAAAQTKNTILKQHKWNLQQTLASELHTVLQPGSKFLKTDERSFFLL